MIEVHHVSKTFGKKQILKDVNFEVKPGERVVIVGKNGEETLVTENVVDYYFNDYEYGNRF